MSAPTVDRMFIGMVCGAAAGAIVAPVVGYAVLRFEGEQGHFRLGEIAAIIVVAFFAMLVVMPILFWPIWVAIQLLPIPFWLSAP